MTDKKTETITTKIWNETPEPDNPFAAAACYCAGYDVYGDLLGKASYIEYLFLLFKLERPTETQAKLLEGLAVALANPGIRDHSVRAAMNAGVGGSTNASALMAAVAVGAGNLNGGREIYVGMEYWNQCGARIDSWENLILNPSKCERVSVWHEMEHPPGFDPNGVSCPTPVKQTLSHLASISSSGPIAWLHGNREDLEKITKIPLAMSGVASAVFFELGLGSDEAEMLYLLLRLPGAGVHALEQKKRGVKYYPFFGDGLKLQDT